jgi:hypothetical protein
MAKMQLRRLRCLRRPSPCAIASTSSINWAIINPRVNAITSIVPSFFVKNDPEERVFVSQGRLNCRNALLGRMTQQKYG